MNAARKLYLVAIHEDTDGPGGYYDTAVSVWEDKAEAWAEAEAILARSKTAPPRFEGDTGITSVDVYPLPYYPRNSKP